MKKKKMSSAKRLGLMIVAGALIGGLSGFAYGSGWFSAFQDGTLSWDLLTWPVRIAAGLFWGLTIFLLTSSRSAHKAYQAAEDDDEAGETLYRQMLKKLEYGMLAFNILSVLVLLDIGTGSQVNIQSNGASFQFFLDDVLMLVLLFAAQAYLFKTIQLIRHFKLSMLAMPSDILDYVRTYDEGEMMANYETSFMIVFRLNQLILPGLYVFLAVLAFITGQVNHMAFLIVAFIHIYINLAQLSMVKNYFK